MQNCKIAELRKKLWWRDFSLCLHYAYCGIAKLQNCLNAKLLIAELRNYSGGETLVSAHTMQNCGTADFF